jgi:integrase
MNVIKPNETDETPQFPIKFDEGGHIFTIYHTPMIKKNREGVEIPYDCYTLAYRQGGNRRRELSADLGALRDRAKEIAEDIDAGHPESTSLRKSERDEYIGSRGVVEPLGVSLLVAATHFAEAFKILGGDLIIEAAREYARRHFEKLEPKLVSEVVEAMLLEKRRDKRSDRHIETLAGHLLRFAETFKQNIDTVTFQDINLFLDSLTKGNPPVPVSNRTRANYANSIVTLLEWAKLHNHVLEDSTDAKKVSRFETDEDGPIEIYTPAEIGAFLSKADSKLIPFLAIGAFAGLRSSEILRLDWADVRLENGDPCIVVQKGKVKKRGKSRRIVPMSENLRKWLRPHTKEGGLVWPFSKPYLYEMLRELAPEAEKVIREKNPKATLEWKPNALRHSCISYRVATIKNVPQVALESGNSPQVIDSHYRELVTDADAKAWFAILPPKS